MTSSRAIQASTICVASALGVFKSCNFAQGVSQIRLSLASLNACAPPGRHDRLPYDSSSMRRICYVCECSGQGHPPCIFPSHDCPENSGNFAQLLKYTSFFRTMSKVVSLGARQQWGSPGIRAWSNSLLCTCILTPSCLRCRRRPDQHQYCHQPEACRFLLRYRLQRSLPAVPGGVAPDDENLCAIALTPPAAPRQALYQSFLS